MNEQNPAAPTGIAVDAQVRPHGVQILPAYHGDFDHYQNRGKYQVRISLWGWPARIVELIMWRSWKKRDLLPMFRDAA